MTATYWEIGRRIVEYGARLLERLRADLSSRFGRGFSSDNLELMRRSYETFPDPGISETLSRKFRIENLVLQNNVLAREYRLALPDEERLREEIQ